jgi:2-polyprenyl-3-methyl-5-hydroxy-6-metoxy-1,4-benzoquinol methylase
VNELDRRIQTWRIRQAIRFLPPDARVLDVGCDDGALFRTMGPALREGVGLDPALEAAVTGERYRLLPGSFPADAPDEPGAFDAVTMLAVMEHVPPDEQPKVAERAFELLRPGGRFVLTVPSPAVDTILDVLIRLHLLHGMEADQHYGFEPDELVPVATAAGFRQLLRSTFQARLNNLFVFEKPRNAG